MSEQPTPIDPAALWMKQPEERSAVTLADMVSRRAADLSENSRAEILGSLGAAIVFVVVISWRMAPSSDRMLWVSLAVTVVWTIITAWRSRQQIWNREPREPTALAASVLEFYQAELVRRVQHLRSGWLWHGPLLLACLTLCQVLVGNGGLGGPRLRGAAPVTILLVGWVAWNTTRRARQIQALQGEIRSVAAYRDSNGGDRG